MPLRIAIDARPLSIPTTGIGRYCARLTTELISTFSECEWFLYSDRPLLGSLPIAANVHLRHGAIKLRNLGSIYAQVVFPMWARQDRIDLFWSPRHHLPVLLSRNVKQVVTIHDLVWKYSPQTMTTLGRLLERTLMPLSIKKADAVVTVSRATANSIVETWPEVEQKIHVIHSGSHFGSTWGEGKRDDQTPYLLFVGTLEPRKNLERVLRAFAESLTSQASLRCLKIVGGDGWGDLDIVSLIDSLGIASYVDVLGFVSDEDLQILYHDAFALLMPSLYEGFGFPILESMSFGVPVITSNRSSMPEVAGHGGMLVDPESVTEISSAIVTLASNPALHEELSANAIRQASRFSWVEAAEKTMKVFNRLMPIDLGNY